MCSRDLKYEIRRKFVESFKFSIKKRFYSNENNLVMNFLKTCGMFVAVCSTFPCQFMIIQCSTRM